MSYTEAKCEHKEIKSNGLVSNNLLLMLSQQIADRMSYLPTLKEKKHKQTTRREDDYN